MKKLNNISAKLFLILITLSVIIVAGCKKNKTVTKRSETPILPSTPYQYIFVEETGQTKDIKELIHDNSEADISNESVTLGRVLFYDTKMSINNTIACASCHKQEFAFADNVSFSNGFSDRKTLRNSMSILNPVTNNNMFWDSRARSPLELSLMPVFNHIEMGMESDAMLVSKLSATSYYPALFEKAFGSRAISREKISLAITQFLNCLFSKKSKFDESVGSAVDSIEVLRKMDPPNFSPLELYGKKLFFSEELKCAECHFGKNFSAPDFVGGPYGGSGGGGSTFNNGKNNNSEDAKGTANIGLDLVYRDNGRGNGKFKIPSLRNIALTAPYMHDGRFRNLDEVLEHYSHGIKEHPNLDPKFIRNGQAVKMNFSESDKLALISFLNTLTDPNLISNPKFADPFAVR
jgi:cytochrome c peroxidase